MRKNKRGLIRDGVAQRPINARGASWRFATHIGKTVAEIVPTLEATLREVTARSRARPAH